VLLCFVDPILGNLTVRGHSLSQGTWGCRILTLHLNFVAGYTGPLLSSSNGPTTTPLTFVVTGRRVDLIFARTKITGGGTQDRRFLFASTMCRTRPRPRMSQFSSFFLALALASLPAVGSWLRALTTLKFAHIRGGKFAATPGRYAAPSLVSVRAKKNNNHIQQKNIPSQLMHLTSPLYNLTAGQQVKQDQMENRQVLLQEKQQPLPTTKTTPSPTGDNLLAQILNPQSPLYDPALGLKMKKELKQEKKTEKQANQPSTTPPPENRLQKQQPPPSPTVLTPPQQKEKKRIKSKTPSPTGVNILSQVLDPRSPSYDPALGLKMKKELKQEKKTEKQAKQPPPPPAMNHLQEKQQPQPLPTVPPSPQQKKKKNKKSQTSSSPTGDNILSQVLDPRGPSNDPQLGLKMKQELKQERGKKTEAKPPPTTPPTIAKKQQPPLSPTLPPPPEQEKTVSTGGNDLVSQVLDPIKLQLARKLKQRKQEELSRVLNPTSPFYDMQLGLRLKQELKEEKITAKRAKLKEEGGGKQRASRAAAVQPPPKVIVK